MVLWQKAGALQLMETLMGMDPPMVVWLLVVWEILTQSFLVVVGTPECKVVAAGM
jgi:hypothetical protein